MIHCQHRKMPKHTKNAADRSHHTYHEKSKYKLGSLSARLGSELLGQIVATTSIADDPEIYIRNQYRCHEWIQRVRDALLNVVFKEHENFLQLLQTVSEVEGSQLVSDWSYEDNARWHPEFEIEDVEFPLYCIAKDMTPETIYQIDKMDGLSAKTSEERMTVQHILKSLPIFSDQIVYSKCFPSRSPRFAGDCGQSIRELLHLDVIEAVSCSMNLSVDRLYEHQVKAIEALRRNKNDVVMATSTNSGAASCICCISALNAHVLQASHWFTTHV